MWGGKLSSRTAELWSGKPRVRITRKFQHFVPERKIPGIYPSGWIWKLKVNGFSTLEPVGRNQKVRGNHGFWNSQKLGLLARQALSPKLHPQIYSRLQGGNFRIPWICSACPAGPEAVVERSFSGILGVPVTTVLLIFLFRVNSFDRTTNTERPHIVYLT